MNYLATDGEQQSLPASAFSIAKNKRIWITWAPDDDQSYVSIRLNHSSNSVPTGSLAMNPEKFTMV